MVVGNAGIDGHAVERDLGCADEVGEGRALAAGRECRVCQRRGVGAAADVGVADGRHLPVRPGERDLPGTERLIGARDLRLRLLASEPAELRGADADAGQDPGVVLLTPGVQDAGAGAHGEQEAQDERDAEAEGERPSAPRPRRRLAVGHGGRERQDRHGIDAGFDGIDDGLGCFRRGLGRRVVGSRVHLGHGPTHAFHERRELAVAGWRLAVGCGGVGRHVRADILAGAPAGLARRGGTTTHSRSA